MNRNFRLAAIAIIVVVAIAAFYFIIHEPSRLVLERPLGVSDTSQLAERRRIQFATLDQFEVFYGFKFSDRYPESGITFAHKTVDDGAKYYKMIHYDHGNGFAVADVDNDGLTDLYFLNHVGANELWRNLGSGRFENITEKAGVGLKDIVSVAASFADIDNDGDSDLYVTTIRWGNHLFENDGTGKFKDITATSGVGHKGHSSSATFFDYDRDGLLDLFLTNIGKFTTEEVLPTRGWTREEKKTGEYPYFVGFNDSTMGSSIPDRDEFNFLYHNLGGNRFEDVTDAMGITNDGWSGDAALMDLNEDGWTDLYVLNMQGHDEYFENQGGKRFVLKTRDVFPKTSYGAMGIEVLDYNNDGRLDIYITDMHSDMWETNEYIGPGREKDKVHGHLPTAGRFIDGNSLFRNDGGMQFAETSDLMRVETYWPWGVSGGDVNADGFEDLFVTGGMNYPFRYGVNSLLLNNRGKRFLDSEFIVGIEPRRGGRTAKLWYEVDCATEEHEVCKSTGATGPVDVMGALGSRSSAIFDLDNDGDLDIVTGEFNAEPMILVSNLTERKPDIRHLTVRLVGTRSNRDGLGAVVRVVTNRGAYVQQMDGKSGYLGQSSLPLYFGLADATRIDRVEVVWPSGTKQVVQSPAPGKTLVVTEG